MTVDMEFQRRLREYEYPRWGYRLDADGEIEKELFDGVLPDGWTDSPAHLQVDAAPPPAAATGDGLAPPYDQYKFRELRAEYKRRTGKGVKVGTDTESLIDMLEKIDAANG